MTHAPTPKKAKSIRRIISHLNVISTSTTDGDRLPEKETITPHQLTWPETSRLMGVRRGHQKCGKVDSTLTAELMGAPNRKQNHTDTDPYGAGEQSGKQVKPDAHSGAANIKARAIEESTEAQHASSATQHPIMPAQQGAPRPPNPTLQATFQHKQRLSIIPHPHFPSPNPPHHQFPIFHSHMYNFQAIRCPSTQCITLPLDNQLSIIFFVYRPYFPPAR